MMMMIMKEKNYYDSDIFCKFKLAGETCFFGKMAGEIPRLPVFRARDAYLPRQKKIMNES